MASFIVVAALAAQAASSTGSTNPTTADVAAPKVKPGQSTYLDLEAGAGYSTNPLLRIGNDQGAGFGRISVNAVHSRVSARSTTLLSAYAENDTYTGHQGSQQSANLFARYDTAISEYARLFFDGSASYQEGGQLDRVVLGIPTVPPPTPGGVITPPILVPPTGDFLSVTGRVFSVSGHANGNFSLSPRDSISIGTGLERVVLHSGPIRTNYTRIPVSLGYDRQLTSRTSIGARISAAQTDYNGPFNFRVITPQLTAQTLLSPTVSLSGAIGASFARTDDGVTIRNSTGLSAQASLCGQGETNYFCARVNADEQAATTAGPARSFGVSVDYSQRLDADQSISFTLGATRYSTPTSVIPSQTFSSSTYYRVAASYSRHLARRIFGGVNLAARKVTQNGPDPDTDFSASLFIRYRFGLVE